ncbi:pumilio homolog 12-like isoform X2 [Momordica charantia]|nr:pumilio homolog 12-like isoform X2 [Momordica charantia]
MEEMGSKLEIELERLIGENPKVASENGHAEESVHKRMSLLAANSCNGMSKLCSNGHLEDVKVLRNKLQQSSGQSNMGRIRTGESNGTGDRSLASALEKLSLGAEETMQNRRVMQNQPNLTEDQLRIYLNKQLLNTETSMAAVPSLRSSNHLTNGYPDVHMTGLGSQNSPSLRHFSDGYNRSEVGHLQPLETPSSARFTYEVPHLDMPSRNLQFPITSHDEEILQSRRSSVLYAHPQQMNHGQIGSNCTQEELLQRYRMQGQYQYLQQQLEYSNSFRSCDDTTSRMLFQSHEPQYFEVPVSHHLEQSNNEVFWKGNAYCRGSNQSNPVFSTQYVDTFQGVEKISRQSSPRKIPTRTHGHNRVDYLKLPAVDGDFYDNQNGAVCSSCYLQGNGLLRTTDCFCHKNLSLYGYFSNHGNRKTTLPQKFNSLEEATGKIYLMAKDQYGCRFLQRKFVEGAKKDIEKIFIEILEHVVELMTDPFGNYLIQKLLEVCNEDQRLKIIYKVTSKQGELIRISCNIHGTRAIQKLIETLKTPEQFKMIISSLKTGIVILMKDLNGNHVAQHCLQYLVPDYIEFLFDAATKFCVGIATDRHGCCVLQKCLGCCNVRQRDSLILEIVRNSLVLSQDQYGNYVVQFTLELAGKYDLYWVEAGILKRLEGHYVDLSIQKYSSNVVEKCLYARDEHLTRIIDELVNDARLSQIMQDPYGNYAIQAALARTNICNSSLHAKLVDAIKLHVPALRTNMFGRKVLAVLGKSH